MSELPIGDSHSSGSTVSPWIAVLSGASAGVMSDGITFPISTAKSRLQVSGSSAGTFSTMLSIVRNEGWTKLYSGFGTVAAAAPARAIYFGSLETVRNEGARMFGFSQHSPVLNFAAGSAAQLTGSLLWVPMELVKERIQVQGLVQSGAQNTPLHIPKTNYTSSANAVSTIIREEGIRGLYRGYFAHQLVWTPFNAIYFSVYESVKGLAVRAWNRDKATPEPLPFVVFPIAGSIAGAFSAAATAPIDLVKTRLQTQGDSKLYSGSFDCVKKIIQHEGAAGLTRGTVARMLWLSPNIAVTMSIYELIKVFFGVEPI